MTKPRPLELQVNLLKLGMLIDLEVFEIQDIIEIINSKPILIERVSEAMDLIK
jgi:hypothetical protein